MKSTTDKVTTDKVTTDKVTTDKVTTGKVTTGKVTTGNVCSFKPYKIDFIDVLFYRLESKHGVTSICVHRLGAAHLQLRSGTPRKVGNGVGESEEPYCKRPGD
jgi:hypothetical protein